MRGRLLRGRAVARWSTLLVVGGIAAAAASCGPAVATSAAVCRLPRTAPGLPDAPRPEQWFRFHVDRGLDGGTADCSGASVRWREPAGCQEPPEPTALLPARAFREDDLVESRLTPSTRLVWAVTDHYANGEGLGPVALVRESATGFDVLAVGSLRARPQRAHLRLETVEAQTYLVAEGESCEAEQAPSTCTRSVVLLRQVEDRFVPVTLVDSRGACVSPGRFDLALRAESALPNGWRRRFELSAVLEFRRDQIVTQEQVIVSDSDPRKADVPPTLVRRADAERVIRGVRGRLVVDDVSLWARVRSSPDEP
jgi:hypothetical protein